MSNMFLSYKTEKIVLFLFILLTVSEYLGQFVWQGTGIRHLYLILLVILFIKRKGDKISVNKSSFKLLIIAIIFYFVLSLFHNNISISTFLGWTFTYFFFILFVPLSVSRNIKFNYHFVLKRIVQIIFLFTLFPFFESLINFPNVRESYGVFRDQSGMSSMLCIATILSNYFWLTTKKAYWKYLIIFFIAAILMTTMKKSIFFIVVWSLFSFLPNTKITFKFNFIILISAVLILILPTIIENINNVLDYESNSAAEDHVRWGMYIGGFILALKYFPFGSGFSSFGSLFSIYDFKSGTYKMSQTYYDLGLNNLADNESKLLTGNTTFLDTYYPHIFAEGGFFQLILIIILIFNILKVFKKKCIQIKDIKLYNTFVWIGLMVFVDGIVINSPEMPVFIFFYSILPGLIIASKN
ncbi:hypothetical protein N9Y38_00400 [Flavobacteriaceae bacterium]|nr:hypothetical protein [Flavobacteriaceae bacterium]